MTEPIDDILSLDEGTTRIVQSDLGRRVGLTRRIGAFTMTVHHVYADANRVVIVYTAPGSRMMALDVIEPAQGGDSSAEMGNELQEIGGFTGGEGRGERASVAIFDAGRIAGDPTEVTLRLIVPAVRTIERIEFTVPFLPGLVATPHQSVAPVTVRPRHAAPYETALTLERVVVAPTETRAYLRGVGYNHVAPTFHVAGRQAHAGLIREVAPGLIACSFPAPWLYDSPDEWALVIHTQWSATDGRWSLTGEPATFRFTIPS